MQKKRVRLRMLLLPKAAISIAGKVKKRAEKNARTRRALVIEAGFIQARNLSSSDPFISNFRLSSKLKV
ncbi:hypothetical protein [Leisingera sp. ANG-M7]|uniref:hypothetical protein n=1 Tax=Leisingera sp. ANG-M7 TaxID=1577902 RepID=UPI0019D3CD04|nr:hypothetical protein [Leisingera sp. ANG-M7]